MNWMLLFGYALFLTIAGYCVPFISRKALARWIAWGMVVLTVGISTLLTSDQSPLLRMGIIVFLQLLSMKIIVVVESYDAENRLTFIQWLAFSCGWFGMRPVLFEKFPSAPLPFKALLFKGMIRVVIGLALIYASSFVDHVAITKSLFLPQLVLLVGLSLVLHFGILNISTALWRFSGVDVSELFRSPYRSKSLKEFWGRRWNLAFSEMTALIAYRPLKEKIGQGKAVAISFLLSGLLHEIAISLPVKAGWGLPMLYFVIHAVAMHLEGTSPLVQKIVHHPVLSHVWVMALLVLPMPLLFHAALIDEVLVPLRTVIFQ